MIVTIAGSVKTVEPTDDELGGLSIGLAAFDGEVGNGTFPFNDAFNTLTAVTGRQLMVEEGSTVLSDGFMIDQDRTRTTEPQGRLYGFGLMDANALLDGFRVTRNRPAETDVARVLAFAAIDGPSWDTSMVLVAETVTMPAKRYDSDGGWTSELIPDVVSYTGKTLFLHDLADGSGRCLHYHNLVSGHLCGLSITDEFDQVDHITAWEPWNPQRTRTSVDLRNDIKAHDQQGRTSTATDPTSISAHDADGLQHQSLTDFEAASQTDLNVQTAAALASQKDDLDTWTCQIGPLDEAALALIRVGDIINITSVAVMGLEHEEQRISHMTLTPAIGTNGTAVPDKWMAELEMGAPIRRRRRKAPKALVDRTTHTPVEICTTTWWMVDTFERTVADTADTLISSGTELWGDRTGVSTTPNSTADATEWRTTATTYTSSEDTHYGVDGGQAYVILPAGSDMGGVGALITNTIIPFPSSGAHWYNLDDIRMEIQVTIDDTLEGPLDAASYHQWSYNIGPLGFLNVYDNDNLASQVPGLYCLYFLDGAFDYTYTRVDDPLPDGTYTLLAWWNPATDSIDFYVNGSNVLHVSESGDPERFGNSIWTLVNDNGYSTGTFEMRIGYVRVWGEESCTEVTAYHWTVFGPFLPVETPDGATATFTIPATAYGTSYIPGTLTAYVDGVYQNVTETDPSAGTFTLGWMPTADEVVKMSWLVP